MAGSDVLRPGALGKFRSGSCVCKHTSPWIHMAAVRRGWGWGVRPENNDSLCCLLGHIGVYVRSGSSPKSWTPLQSNPASTLGIRPWIYQFSLILGFLMEPNSGPCPPNNSWIHSGSTPGSAPESNHTSIFLPSLWQRFCSAGRVSNFASFPFVMLLVAATGSSR